MNNRQKHIDSMSDTKLAATLCDRGLGCVTCPFAAKADEGDYESALECARAFVAWMKEEEDAE